MLTAKQNAKGQVEPQVGEIWRDKTGQHNLVTRIYRTAGADKAEVLTLETGIAWPNEDFDSWSRDYRHFDSDGPFYQVLVG